MSQFHPYGEIHQSAHGNKVGMLYEKVKLCEDEYNILKHTYYKTHVSNKQERRMLPATAEQVFCLR